MCMCVRVNFCHVYFLRAQVLLPVSFHVAISLYSGISIIAGVMSLLLPIETKGREMTVSGGIKLLFSVNLYSDCRLSTLELLFCVIFGTVLI